MTKDELKLLFSKNKKEEGNSAITKKKLKELLTKYKGEISNNNNEHIKDLIAVMVLLDLSCRSNNVEDIDINNTTLKTLMFWGATIDDDIKRTFIDRKNSEYLVPTMREINLLKRKYKKGLENSYRVPYNYVNENASTTWIEMMINFGIITEGQIINLEEFRFVDFITDNSLAEMFDETKDMSIRNYIRS